MEYSTPSVDEAHLSLLLPPRKQAGEQTSPRLLWSPRIQSRYPAGELTERRQIPRLLKLRGKLELQPQLIAWDPGADMVGRLQGF